MRPSILPAAAAALGLHAAAAAALGPHATAAAPVEADPTTHQADPTTHQAGPELAKPPAPAMPAGGELADLAREMDQLHHAAGSISYRLREFQADLARGRDRLYQIANAING